MRRPSPASRAAAAITLTALPGCADRTDYPTFDKQTPGIFLDIDPAALAAPAGPLRPVSARGLALTKRAEGFEPRLYIDGGRYCSIAYGHLVSRAPCDGGEPAEFRRGVTEPEGAALLTADMALARAAVSAAVSAPLTDGQYAALCDFVYNVGPGNFRASTLLKVVNARDQARVPGQFRRWVFAGGKRLAGLAARRESEIAMFFDGRPIPPAPADALEDLSPLDIRAGEGRRGA